jgi:hypothetical protein
VFLSVDRAAGVCLELPGWRRARADFCGTAPETQNLLVRHDYDADVLGGVPASNGARDYREFGGIMFPAHRLVTARSADGAAGAGPTLVGIEFGDITVD